MRNLHKVLLCATLAALAVGCTTVMQPPMKSLDSGSSRTVGSKYTPKVSNFQVVIDTSISMNDGIGANYFLAARKVVRRINRSIPADLSYRGGLRSFGHDSLQSNNPTELLYGMSAYDSKSFHVGLQKIKYTGGGSPMAAALEAAGNDLSAGTGKSALILVSDGLHMGDAPAAAKKIKAKLGADLCIYTIAIGQKNNGAGHDLLQKIADTGQCGYALKEIDLADEGKLTSFIDDVFVMAKKPAPQLAKDTDGDGVTDFMDKCPNTPRGEFVDENGCTLKLTLHINFDFDKAEIKPEFKPDLDRAAAYIKHYKVVPYILIAGHTDHSGTLDYNQQLSEDRANAVRQYLVDNYAIDGKRLFAKGYGKLKPMADNMAKEGRYQNRRVEIICCVLLPEMVSE